MWLLEAAKKIKSYGLSLRSHGELPIYIPKIMKKGLKSKLQVAQHKMLRFILNLYFQEHIGHRELKVSKCF